MKKFLPLYILFFLVACFAAYSASQQDSAPESGVKAGDTAPDFELQATDGKMKKLSGLKGKKNVLVAFYPKANTMG